MAGSSLLVIPDPQIKVDSDLMHLRAAGNYIVKHKPDTIVAIGDWCDMESLSRYATNLEREGKRIAKDVEAGKKGMLELLGPLQRYNQYRRKHKQKQYNPRLVFTKGNHDPTVRLERLVNEYPVLQGFVEDTFDDFLRGFGWEVYEYLEIVNLYGIRCSHFHINPHSARKAPLGGTIDTMLKNAGYSFIMGHQQGLKIGKHYLADGTKRLGIVAGSFYQEDEAYMGRQGNKAHWRGIIQIDNCKEGSGDIKEMSLESLMEQYL